MISSQMIIGRGFEEALMYYRRESCSSLVSFLGSVTGERRETVVGPSIRVESTFRRYHLKGIWNVRSTRPSTFGILFVMFVIVSPLRNGICLDQMLLASCSFDLVTRFLLVLLSASIMDRYHSKVQSECFLRFVHGYPSLWSWSACGMIVAMHGRLP